MIYWLIAYLIITLALYAIMERTVHAGIIMLIPCLLWPVGVVLLLAELVEMIVERVEEGLSR